MNRVITFHSFVALALSLPSASAGEVAIEKRPFMIRHALVATAMPDQVTLLQATAQAWSDFEITHLVLHGSRVSKGEVLISFDPEAIDMKLHDTRKALETRAIEMEQTRKDLAHLETTTPHRLNTLKRAADEAKEENAYFTNTRRKASEEGADQSLRRAEISLENEREELRQLEKMYAADDLTEETEEIILLRQKDQVIAAEFNLRMQKLTHQRTRQVLLPREATTFAEAERDTAIAFAKFSEEAPRAIARKKLELEALGTATARDKKLLAKLEADRQQSTLTAPADGWFYHGVIENGRWTTGEVIKPLVLHGKIVPRRPFATLIASGSTLKLVAAVDGPVFRQLSNDNSGVAWLAGREDVEFPVKVSRLSAAPEPDGRYTIELSATWPDALALAPAAQVHVNLMAYVNPDAIVLPIKALEHGADSWTVAVKLANGNTERRPVKRGRIFKDECEIISGLEAGQVVIVP